MDEVEVVPVKKGKADDTQDFRKRYKKNGGNNYRKNELKLKKGFLYLVIFHVSCFLIAIMVQIINHHLFHNPQICAWMTMLEVFLSWVSFTVIFVALYKLLKKFHSFEFELRSNHMISFFIMIYLIYVIKGIEQVIIVYCYGSYDGQEETQTSYCT